ncbi:PAS domain S-box protein [Pelobacter seleniigenes]|uniref:PAS domain S-box protein n=1 Tax=Pelobacter seleniigenes TaxID=407188 RepID=UPI00068DC857|nr:PAS domain S-box protein [Pelobacter seleniigenes]
MLQAFLDEAEKLTDSRIGFFCCLEEDQNRIALQTWSTNTLQNRCQAGPHLAHAAIDQAGIWAECVQTRRPVVHNSFPNLGRQPLPPGHAPILTELIVPIIRKDRIVAILGVGNKPSGYDSNDIDLLHGLADVSWDIIARQQSEDELVQVRQQLDEALAQTAAPRAFREFSERKYWTLLEEAHFAISLADAKTGIILECNKALADMLERSPAELIGQPQAILHAEKVAAGHLSRNFIRHRDQLPGSVLEDRLLTKTGRPLDVEIHAQKFTLENREVMLAIIQDISARKHAQQELREAQQRYRLISENVTDVVWTMDLASEKFTYFSPSVELLRGYTPAEALQMSLTETLTAESCQRARQRIAEISAQPFDPLEDSWQYGLIELQEYHRDGSIIDTEILARFLRDKDGTPTGLLGVTRDISARKRAEQALQLEKDKFRTLFEHVPDYALVLKPEQDDLIIADLSDSACASHGFTREELLGQSIRLVDPADHVFAGLRGDMERLKAGQTVCRETLHRRKDGTTFPVQALVRLIQMDNQPLLFSIEQDLTVQKIEENERLKLEQQLRQKYKMEAVGLMAAGIAHNFNNNLAIILGNLELIKINLPADATIREYLHNATIGIRRSRELIQQIMTYSRQESRTRTVVQPALIIEETLKLLRSTVPSSVELRCQLPPTQDSISINADPTAIQEALINLCTNAVHAMHDKGLLTISLDKVELAQQDIPAQYNCQPGIYARIEVQDLGMGMNRATLEKVFDPFFTTKEVDQGTGMGLATVQGIVEQHAGLINVHSSPGQGSSFALFFPVTEAQQHDSSEHQEPLSLPGGVERILLVDDEASLALVNSAMLGEMGYRVEVETSSRQALKRLTDPRKRFDLLITDQIMPGLTGIELARLARQIDPNLPIILCTGYSDKAAGDEMDLDEPCAYCMKPLDMAELLTTVRTVLDHRR